MRIFEQENPNHKRNPVGILEEDSDDEDTTPLPAIIPQDEGDEDDETGRKERDSTNKD